MFYRKKAHHDDGVNGMDVSADENSTVQTDKAYDFITEWVSSLH